MVIKKSNPARPREEFPMPAITFLGEQDGEPERVLKSAICEVLQESAHIIKAYLAIVRYDNEQHLHVALCLLSGNPDDVGLVEKIGEVFAGIFSPHEHLDTVFVSTQQDRELASVCKPFYERLPTSA